MVTPSYIYEFVRPRIRSHLRINARPDQPTSPHTPTTPALVRSLYVALYLAGLGLCVVAVRPPVLYILSVRLVCVCACVRSSCVCVCVLVCCGDGGGCAGVVDHMNTYYTNICDACMLIYAHISCCACAPASASKVQYMKYISVCACKCVCLWVCGCVCVHVCVCLSVQPRPFHYARQVSLECLREWRESVRNRHS